MPIASVVRGHSKKNKDVYTKSIMYATIYCLFTSLVLDNSSKNITNENKYSIIPSLPLPIFLIRGKMINSIHLK